MKKIIVLGITIVIIFFSFTISANNNLKYLDSINAQNTSNLIKDSQLNPSIIVVLDTGIQWDYYKYVEGSYMYQAGFNPDYGGVYHTHPWTNYKRGNNHGTEIIYVINDIVNVLKTNSNQKNYSQAIMVYSYKLCDANGWHNAKRLINAINVIIDKLVLEQNLNISVINYSNGLIFKNPKSKESETLIINLQNAINRLNEHGISFVTSSGNTNSLMKGIETKLDNVIVVGAVNEEHKRWTVTNALGSSYGKELDLVAPGSNISVGFKRIGNGSSYAAPMVSTTVALIKSINPELKPVEIESILKSQAIDIGKAGKDIYFGFGLLNVYDVIEEVINE